VIIAAFGSQEEAALVDQLRADGVVLILFVKNIRSLRTCEKINLTI
jgi:hypothetical protein